MSIEAIDAAIARLTSIDAAAHADVIDQLKSARADALVVPAELAELSTKASPDWKLARISTVILGGAVKSFDSGSSQTQIASFTAPIDSEDPVTEQQANALLALKAVEFVRSLLARS